MIPTIGLLKHPQISYFGALGSLLNYCFPQTKNICKNCSKNRLN
ncbi:hypothetical protein GXM_02459 [Nostoc sphaeroides CCNUC1]|uniref:Uncharacterized protein n=1 Tax=Nostoc sphaeroides CCNUC1 TaxID=2653204 RepID=A0A5P8VX84_9NOSO|nr:hypothetical protein GXM_02459 [Nostoc sphaeroides CCNUC1]